jgi:hypothetical protein
MSPTDEMEVGHYYHIKNEVVEDDGRRFRYEQLVRCEQLAWNEQAGEIFILANLCFNFFAFFLKLNVAVPFFKDKLIYQEEVLIEDFPLFVSWKTGTEFSKLLKGE